MKDKIEKRPVRNKEQSKQKFLDAVGKIITEKGFPGLKINDIAATAGLDKKLIYRYFGNLQQLIDQYISTQDFWSNVNEEQAIEKIEDGGRTFVKSALKAQFEYIRKNEAFRKLLLWRLSEEKESLRKLTENQEASGEALFKSFIDPHFGKKAEQFRAISAILVSGIYYLNLFSQFNGSVFCGIDLNTPQGKHSIEEALNFLVDLSYDNISDH